MEKRAKPTTIDLGGKILPLNLKTNARARRMTLKIEPGGHAISLTTPPGLARHEIDGFLRRHHDWLLERMARFEGRNTHITEGSTVSVLGAPHIIRHSGNLRGITESRHEGDSAVLLVSGPAESIGRRVADYLKKVAKHEITECVKTHAAKSGRSYAAISFKDTRSRWGSCSSAGNLNFSGGSKRTACKNEPSFLSHCRASGVFGQSFSHNAQKRGPWFISERCATSWAAR